MDHSVVLKYFPELTAEQIARFARLKDLYENWNAQINVISRKDMDNFYIHHVLHSLAIAKVLKFKPGAQILDVGTGGGFPGVPLAIMFPESRFHLVDSIGKKIKVVEEVAKELGLNNVMAEKARVEELKSKYDFVVSRAVAQWSELHRWTAKLIMRNGNHALPNGWLLLKGGDLDAEFPFVKNRMVVHDISAMFEDEFFETKKVIYLPA